jgi:hypothetical protein
MTHLLCASVALLEGAGFGWRQHLAICLEEGFHLRLDLSAQSGPCSRFCSFSGSPRATQASSLPWPAASEAVTNCPATACMWPRHAARFGMRAASVCGCYQSWMVYEHLLAVVLSRVVQACKAEHRPQPADDAGLFHLMPWRHSEPPARRSGYP